MQHLMVEKQVRLELLLQVGMDRRVKMAATEVLAAEVAVVTTIIIALA